MLKDLVFLNRYNGGSWHSQLLHKLLDNKGYKSLDEDYYYVMFSLNVCWTNQNSLHEEVEEQIEISIPYAYIKDTVKDENDLIMFVDDSYPYARPYISPETREQIFNQNMHFLTFFKKSEEYVIFKLMHEKSNQGIFEFGVLDKRQQMQTDVNVTFYEDLKFRFHLDLGNVEASFYGSGAYKAIEKFFENSEISKVLKDLGLVPDTDYEFDYSIYDREEIDGMGLTRVYVKALLVIKEPKYETMVRLVSPKWFQ